MQFHSLLFHVLVSVRGCSMVCGSQMFFSMGCSRLRDSAFDPWFRFASRLLRMLRQVFHGLLRGMACRVDFHGLVYGRFRRYGGMFPRSGGHIPVSVHERMTCCSTIWRTFVSYWRCCIMTAELPCALAFLPDMRKKIPERRNRD